jgi:hypothetical protein
LGTEDLNVRMEGKYSVSVEAQYAVELGNNVAQTSEYILFIAS